MESQKFAKELIDFIYQSHTAFHAADSSAKLLTDCGYTELFEDEKWALEKEGKYFVTKNTSAVIAFQIGNGELEKDGFRIIGAHTDSPCFRIKPKPEIVSDEAYLKLNTEVYGSPILNTWLDRPLAIAGRVTLKSENIMKPRTKLVNINRPILIIPNLAIHMNINVNKGVALNEQKDLLPVVGLINDELQKDNFILKLMAEELKIDIGEILDFDLFLYEFEKGSIIGINNEFISSSRLDDLAMVHAGIIAITKVGAFKGTKVMVCFDNEEVGSTTKQGAGSPMLTKLLERITICLGLDREDYFRTLSNSFLISADLAHAIHPNMSEKADPINRPIINKGPVIKVSARQSYTSDSFSVGVYQAICEKAGVSVQKFVNRSDERGGSTIGPISSHHLDINAVDMGSPIIAMHSVRELAGVEDHLMTEKSF